MCFDVRRGGRGGKDKSWRGLRFRFIEWGLRRGDPEVLWRTVTSHPWCRRELRELSAAAARRNRLPRTAAEDVMQDAVLLLMRLMQRTPDLSFDLALPEASFPGWLGRIIEDRCHEAARRLWRRTRREVPLAAEPTCDPRPQSEEPRDLAAAIAGLADPDRQILDAARRGRTLRQTADRAGLSYGQTKRAYHRGVRALRERFADEG